MHVYFCGRDIFMSQHHLYGPQVGTSLEQMSGKAVTEGVREFQRQMYECCTAFLKDYAENCVFDVSADEKIYDVGLIFL